MKFEYLFVSILVFGLIFTVGFSVYSGMLSSYDKEVDTSTTFGQVQYELKQAQDSQTEIREDIEGGTVTSEDAVDDMVAGGYTGIRKRPFKMLGIFANSTVVMVKETGLVDPNIQLFFYSVIGFLALFALIAMIFKFRSD